MCIYRAKLEQLTRERAFPPPKVGVAVSYNALKLASDNFLMKVAILFVGGFGGLRESRRC